MNSPIAHTDTSSAQQVRGTGILNAAIPRRHIDFAFEHSHEPLAHSNDPFMTLLMGALSSLFPAGEGFFVESVRHFRDQISDPALLKDVQAFIGQEAIHSQQHVHLNELYSRNGIDVAALEAHTVTIINTITANMSWKTKLAITLCLEHFTAIFAERLLTDPVLQSKIESQARQVWLWHALEESEHKAVAFDVFKTVGGSNTLRMVTMLPISVIFIAVILGFQTKLLVQQKQIFNLKQTLASFNYFIGPRGFLVQLAPKYFDFFKPSFHPNDHDTVALITSWRERLFGLDGEVIAKLKKVV